MAQAIHPTFSAERRAQAVESQIEQEEQGRSLVGRIPKKVTNVLCDLSMTVRSMYTVRNMQRGVGDLNAVAAFGMTTCASLVMAPPNIYAGYVEYKAAAKTRDVWAKQHGKLQMAQGISFFLGALLYLPIRFLTLFKHSLSNAAQVISSCSMAGEGVFGVGMLCAIIMHIMELYSAIKFHSKLKKIEQDPNKDRLCFQLLREMKEEERDRVAGPSSLALSVTDVNFFKEVLNGNEKKIKDALLHLVLSSAYLVSIILGSFLVASNPAFALASVVIAIVVGLSYLILNAQELKSSFEHAQIGRHDKLWLFISCVVCFIAIITFHLMTSGMLPFIITAVLSVTLAAFHVIAYKHIRHLEAQELEKKKKRISAQLNEPLALQAGRILALHQQIIGPATQLIVDSRLRRCSLRELKSRQVDFITRARTWYPTYFDWDLFQEELNHVMSEQNETPLEDDMQLFTDALDGYLHRFLLEA